MTDRGQSTDPLPTWALGGDLVVRRLGFGAMRITGPGIWGQPADRDEAMAVLRRTVELGVNLIDTADAYGPNVSEQLIADALFPYPEDLVIGTKGGLLRDGPNQWRPDGRPEHLRDACEGSLKRLRLDQIPLYQFHRPDPAVPFEESVGALDDLKREGKIRHVALCNVDEEELDQADAITPIVSVQNRYSPTDRTSESLLNRCEVEEIAFLPWAPLDAGKVGRHPVVQRIAAQHDASASQVGIAWLLAHSPALVPIPGTGSVAHLEENMGAAKVRLTTDELHELDQI